MSIMNKVFSSLLLCSPPVANLSPCLCTSNVLSLNVLNFVLTQGQVRVTLLDSLQCCAMFPYLQRAARKAADGWIISDLKVMHMTIEHCGREMHPPCLTGHRHLTVVIVKKALHNGRLAHPLSSQHRDPERRGHGPVSASPPVGRPTLPALANSWPMHSEWHMGST